VSEVFDPRERASIQHDLASGDEEVRRLAVERSHQPVGTLAQLARRRIDQLDLADDHRRRVA
jgi:hypothetical protein